MFPWRLYHYGSGGTFTWVTTHALWVTNSLSTDETLLAGGGGFVVRGGGNVACHLEPQYCGETDEGVYYKIFYSHPIKWTGEKLKLLPDYWFAPLEGLVTPLKQPSVIDNFVNTLFALCFIGMFFLHYLMRTKSVLLGAFVVSIAVAASHVAIVVFSHFEVRYFFFIKIYSVFMCLLLVSFYLNREGSKR